jgi:hypothetical protein
MPTDAPGCLSTRASRFLFPRFHGRLALVATARIHLLSVAVERLGALELAKRLNVPAVVLQDWIDHKTPIPPARVLELIDLLDSLDAF